MANYSNFAEGLAAGKVGEDFVIKILTQCGYTIEDVSQNSDYFSKDIDLIANKDDTTFTIEVKADSLISTTGNIAIEIMTNVAWNKKGWFYYTEADYIYFVDVNNHLIHCVATDELRTYYKENISYIRHKNLTQYEHGGSIIKEVKLALIPVKKLKTLKSYKTLSCFSGLLN